MSDPDKIAALEAKVSELDEAVRLLKLQFELTRTEFSALRSGARRLQRRLNALEAREGKLGTE